MTGVAVAAITVRFWGVRGSIACPGIEHARYGGNTACVEVRCGDRVFIFDAGTGARALGHALVRTGPVDTDIFLSHCHIDHISGLPFFAPSYSPMSRIRLWAGNLLPEYRIEKVLRTMMNEPLFPAPVEAFTAKIEFRDFRAVADRLRDVVRSTDIVARFGGDEFVVLQHPMGNPKEAAQLAERIVAALTDPFQISGHD